MSKTVKKMSLGGTKKRNRVTMSSKLTDRPKPIAQPRKLNPGEVGLDDYTLDNMTLE